MRNKGTNPRRYREKYKGLDPLRIAEEAGKVAARGQTPAGTHRSIMVDGVMDRLSPNPGESALDATLDR